MLFSKAAKLAGGRGFFFDGDVNAPPDAFAVAKGDGDLALNLPAGADYDFQSDGLLIVFPAAIPTEAEVKAKTAAESWGRIKAERDRRKAGGVKIGEKWFHSDDGSRIQQMGLVMMGAGLPAGLQWKTMDGSFITMTPALAQQVFAGQAASDQTIFAVAEAHCVAMEASADPAAYDYSTGWPKIFRE